VLQRIWRDDPNEKIKTYELLILIYVTAPASFLVTKMIQQLVDLEENQFPKSASIARRDFYMDDLITGANSLEEVLVIRDEVLQCCFEGKDSFLGNRFSIIRFVKRHSRRCNRQRLFWNWIRMALSKHWVSNGIMQRTFFNIQSR